MLNSKLINGKCMAVEESLHKEGPSVASTRLRVRNVPTALSANALRDLFRKYGAILAVEITDNEAIVVRQNIYYILFEQQYGILQLMHYFRQSKPLVICEQL